MVWPSRMKRSTLMSLPLAGSDFMATYTWLCSPTVRSLEKKPSSAQFGGSTMFWQGLPRALFWIAECSFKRSILRISVVISVPLSMPVTHSTKLSKGSFLTYLDLPSARDCKFGCDKDTGSQCDKISCKYAGGRSWSFVYLRGMYGRVLGARVCCSPGSSSGMAPSLAPDPLPFPGDSAWLAPTPTGAAMFAKGGPVFEDSTTSPFTIGAKAS
mmetsp:Transcript_111029/g.314970  ORF Transcript_111029/g.314970 Transcript_111029/m.314970 type:complete len:213 (+) Transcript_111029:427-1065(+)